MAATDVDDISQHIIANHKYFDELLALVPARYYFAKEVEENKWNKYAKNKKDDKTVVKGKKTRKPREDETDFSKTVPEILLDRYRATADIAEETPAPTPKAPVAAPAPVQPTPAVNNNAKKIKKPASAESDDEEDNQSDSDEMEVDAVVGADDGKMESFMANSSREEARQKLLEKINELRKKRKAVELDDKFRPRTDIEAPPSKRRKTGETDASETGDQKKTNKQLKQDNIEKLKKQQENKRQKQMQAAAEVSDDDVEESNGQNEDEPNPADIQFGTFDFSTGKPVPTYLSQKRKRPSNHVLLKKAEAEKKKMDELAGTAEGDAMREDKAWDAVMKRAAGEKVKDKPELLKKSIKRRETQKKKSATKWKERTDMVSKQQEDKQKKRQENIQMALQRKRDKRMGIKPSDKRSGGGKNRPGFEGKKSSFINK